MNNSNMQQTTFWKFLKKQKIEIPIIQRDYAQGRIGKEKLREKFLTDMKNALDGSPKDEKKLKLDFVYGSVENDRLNPLDGQQRLTTLWLLHWYIAYKSGIFSESKSGIFSESKGVFKNFSYETRTSSREFCKKLSDFNIEPSGSIVELIQNQIWFFSVWKQDPTIQAMLNMLGGTPIKDSKDNEILDGIEEVFKDCDYLGYWEKLINEECPIVFYYLDLLDLTLSDDLYIKMNARGKSLTNFENFKADLVGFIKGKGWEDEWKKERINYRLEKEGKEKQYEILKDEDNPNKTIAHKLDTDWTDIFWKYRSEDHKIDDIYFAFINRYFLNSLIIARKDDYNYLYTQEELESNKLFKFLYGESGIDSNIQYNGFDIYESECENFDYKIFFDGLTKSLDNFHAAFKFYSIKDINKLFKPGWDDKSDFYFIPEYVNKEGKEIPTQLTQPQRVVFYAVCSFFKNNTYDETAFRKWIRIVWNIVENASISTISSMIGTMRLIDNLAIHSDEIYEHLKYRDVSKDFAYEQIKEEKEKAIRLIEDKNWKDKSGKTWEEKINEAEKTAFFKGAIRFLYKTDNNMIDWNKFDERFYKSKIYFDLNGAAIDYKKDAVLLRALISKFSEFDHFKGEIFDNNAASWKTILLNKHLISAIVQFFDITDILSIDFTTFNSTISDERLRYFQNDICKSTILNFISPKSYFHWWNYGKYSLFPYNTKSQSKIYVFADKRNQVISSLDGDIIDVDNWQRVEGLPYFRGWELYFVSKLNNKKYQWWDFLKEQTDIGIWIKISDVNLDNLKAFLESGK